MSKKSTKSDLAKVDGLKDENIDYTDIPALDEALLSRAIRVSWPPPPKKPGR
jgi:hypothetical protein